MSPEELEELKEALALAKQTLRSTTEDLHFTALAATAVKDCYLKNTAWMKVHTTTNLTYVFQFSKV